MFPTTCRVRWHAGVPFSLAKSPPHGRVAFSVAAESVSASRSDGLGTVGSTMRTEIDVAHRGHPINFAAAKPSSWKPPCNDADVEEMAPKPVDVSLGESKAGEHMAELDWMATCGPDSHFYDWKYSSRIHYVKRGTTGVFKVSGSTLHTG